MFQKRKQSGAQTTQSNWQEPRVAEPAAGEAESGKSARETPAGANATSSKPVPRPDASAVLNRQPAPPVRPDSSRRGALPGSAPARSSEQPDSKKLIVGRDISLAGEIRTCETLVVEGTVEAQLTDTLTLDIQDGGLFKGTAVVDTAEIAGRFEGELTVRKRLYVRATGNVHGTIKYRGLEIESGGRIGGTLTELTDEDAQVAGQPRANGAAPAAAGISGGDA